MSAYQIKTRTELETIHVAEQLAQFLKPGDVVTLEGDLGAGKTTFAKGLAAGFGVTRVVNSPTFNIIKEYKGELPFYHMDVYRLEDSDEDIGFEEYFNGDGVCLVEWAHFISDFLPSEYLNINITYVDDNTRLLEIFPKGEHFDSVTADLIGSL
ncbi:tRNA (adenosine(37)-N6)-threonylcarbamoyltransferase complex ATPase subunit type 1 TsaE [Lentibacillus sp.]|jgi:tRNA threonylcarbamoyladenosine biosynthesis protein TsaE|uniref:tRNA (adenosine(37)-N6)-threonylcarbamoyltransferase complex ATPase subunit type 1 TsaE n=1 Tax=Lentibacillus sp. TaxID=1925746 RepID=UPI002B4B64DD|nr:tRNA (adenosine(37)-N6)-threonylcarbamoyltransferase complex ATPase subunit type 1 TsaE [Lentibacillus sp.]HLS08010.1 tRNA (adenosine(37)-N6)-threonylcarbamoyltransferase complex ATPase subunit type 1 TsaE [Lentibacillus sp.]